MKVRSKKTFLDFDKNSKDTFDLLKKKCSVPGYEPTNVDVFMFALAYGFKNKNKVDVIVKSGTGVRVEYLKPEHELLMSAIQLAETENPEILLDQEARFLLAEKYAEGGARLLKIVAEQPGNFLQEISGEMVELFSAISKGQL